MAYRVRQVEMVKFLAVAGLNVTTLSVQLGMSRPHVSKVLRGITEPGDLFVARFREAFPALSTEDLFADSDPLLTPTATAELLAVSLDTLRRWTAAGVLPVIHLAPRMPRYRTSDVDAFLAHASRTALTGGSTR